MTDARVLMCPSCGAPEHEHHSGPSFPCSYCGALIRIHARRGPIRFGGLPAGVSAEAAERARLVSLQAQAARYDYDGDYCYFHAPDGLDYLAAMDETDESFFPTALAAFKLALDRCEADPGRMESERRVFWVARKLKNSCVQRDEPLRAKAAVETALDQVTDPGYRQLLTCILADALRTEGNLEACEALLEQCDPRPPLLDLDTEYRTSLGMVLASRGRWPEVLALVGERRGMIPYEPSSVAVFHSLRVVALESLRRSREAADEMAGLVGDLQAAGGTLAFLERMYRNSEVWRAAKTVLARHRARRRRG
jgi:hypothetical protein